jgi:hypothetical protein
VRVYRIFLSNEDILSITTILDAGEESMHDNLHGRGKELMMEAPKKKISKKKLQEIEKELKKAMAETSVESPYESAPMDLNTEEAPQWGKE